MHSATARLGVLSVLALSLILIFLLTQVYGDWDYALSRRGAKLLAIVMTGSAVAVSTVVFQAITNNRILTPSIIGFDSLYLLIQTVIVFLFGAGTSWLGDARVNFIMSVACMIVFALALYRALFAGDGKGLFHILLLGVILGTLFQSLASVMQVLIDPNEFFIIQDRMFASINNVRTDLLGIAAATMLVVVAVFLKYVKYLDVLALGREHAISLGVEYGWVVNRLLIVVAAMIALATALVGPITFLGLLVANLGYQLLNTHRHIILMAGASLIAVVALVGGQLVVERVLSFSTTLSVIINFFGGLYFIALLLKESRA